MIEAFGKVAQVFYDVILPILLVLGAGYVAQKKLKLNLNTVARLGLYVLSPCLGFSSLVHSKSSSNDTFGVIAIMLGTTALMWLAGSLANRYLQQSVFATSAFLLATLFTNAGNYGVPLMDLAFGSASRDLAVIAFVTQQFLFNTLAIYLATRGTLNWRETLLRALRMPTLIAVVLAVIVVVTGVSVPSPIDKATTLLGNAALPVILLSLGIQLAETTPSLDDAPRISLAVIFRLILSPAIALFLVWALNGVFNMSVLAIKVAIVAMAMPSAVTIVLMAIEFKADPKMVSSVAFFSTLASVITLTLILTLLI